MRVLPAFVVVLALEVVGTAAYAQCNSNASSCVTCHETQGLRSVIKGTQPWHVGHGFGDLCASCHAGDPSMQDKERAHVGLRQPMADTTLACGGCHPTDTAARIERYVRDAQERAAKAEPPKPVTHSPLANIVLGVLCAGLAVAIGLVAWKRPPPRERLQLGLRDQHWSPVAAGVLLGVVVAISEVFFARPIGVSGAFDKLAAFLGVRLFADSQFYGHVMKPGITVQVWTVVGLFLGSFVASALSGEVRTRWLPDTQWVPRFGPDRLKRLAIAFGGAVLVQFGAGIAGGCTSGLAISGGATLAPAAFLFMMGMFAGGIPTAWLWYRGRADP